MTAGALKMISHLGTVIRIPAKLADHVEGKQT
jgi:hypothetical protein